ncbi:hypothetical protein [Devosia sp.]|uniref:HTH-like domain-containing protein n=1 Tax=Devosia sp. TaxID=1871048 RepID=UPI002732436D|nr:hypothetical protein [Devosia sp.]MDP2782328.1 hypothetical protein [Devosia sp.]
MRIEDAAQLLSERYSSAGDGSKVVAIHVFGIEFADQIRNMSKVELATRAGISPKYGTELNKAVRLAEFVRLK